MFPDQLLDVLVIPTVKPTLVFETVTRSDFTIFIDYSKQCSIPSITITKFKLRDNFIVYYLVNITIKLTFIVAKKIPVSIFVSLNSI